MPNKTPFFAEHRELHAEITDFHGWLLPLYYETPIAEHNAVRQKAGLFDVSHMGVIQVEGKDALQVLQKLLVRDIGKMQNQEMRLAVMCNENGGILDDLTVYRFGEEKFWLVVNATPYENDLKWLQQNAKDLDAKVTGLRQEMAKLDLQGPKAEAILQKLADCNLEETKYYGFREMKINYVECVASRSGYTGEQGFELYFNAGKAEQMWQALTEAGKEFGLKACGLAARNTLRLEAGMLLYGQDMDESKSPLQSDYRKLVCWEKQFVGKPALAKKLEQGVKEKLVGFELIEKGIAREGNTILKNGKEAGIVSSGSFSPTLKKSIGLGYIGSQFASDGTEFEVEVRGKEIKASVVKLPFYKRGEQQDGKS